MTRSYRHLMPRIARPVVFILAAVFAAAVLQSARATDVCGAVCDETWTVAGSPYVVTCDVTVTAGCSLTIESGVEVRSQLGYGLRVTGMLDVNGTEAAPVTFTADSGTPQVGDWLGLLLLSDSTATIDHATITYGDDGIRASNVLSLDLNGVTAKWNGTGLAIESVGGSQTYQATACTFTENNEYGVAYTYLGLLSGSTIAITGSSIHSNLGPYDLATANQGGGGGLAGTIDARGNWWNETDSNLIESRIVDSADYPGSQTSVNWCGFLNDAPPFGEPVRDVNCPDLRICDETKIWNDTAAPYLVVSDVYICDTGTLQIEPGVEVRTVATDGQARFVIRGVLDVSGTPAAPVLFTSDAATPQAGDWGGLSHSGDDAEGNLQYVTLEYADTALRASYSASVIVDNISAQRNNVGLAVEGGSIAHPATTVTATSSSFTENQLYGVEVGGSPVGSPPDPVVTVNGSSIHTNYGSYDYMAHDNFVNPSQTLNARGNWWGTADTTAIASRIHDHNDLTGSPFVDWCAYLDGQGGSAPDVECPDFYPCDGTVVWSETSRPYLLTSNLVVCPTGTLQVDPGVEVRAVKVSPALGIRVEGVLDVNGTPGAPVTFTSSSDTPAVADWSGIKLTASSTSDIEHASITYADLAIRMQDAAQATLTGVTAQNNRYAMYVAGSGPPGAIVSGCTFTGNQVFGVSLYGSPNPDFSITGSSIYNNLGAYDLATGNYTNSGTTVLDARGNYWGSIDPAFISGRIYDRVDGTYGPRVDWCGYLNGPGGSAEKDMHCPELVACDGTVLMDLTDKPYQLVSPLYVCPTGTLQVEPGVESRAVVAYPKTEVWVEGVLDVNGTEGAAVTFTSDADTPAVADWFGLRLDASSTSDIEYAEVSYSDLAIRVQEAAQATLTGVTAQNNRYAMYVSGAGPPGAIVSGCTFTGNQVYGVYLYGSPNPDFSITGSSIHSNLGAYDLATQNYTDYADTIVWATDNWWGTTDETAIGNRIYDYYDFDYSPRVYFRASGEECDQALGRDADGDGHGDFEDNCPRQDNASQVDADSDLMGDACDPEPGVAPSLPCDGIDDALDGYSDSDSDGWGDPCDFQPTRDDSHPGAPELCDARDNDGDGLFAIGELVDDDFDENVACGDCDELEPTIHVCACEICGNFIDDDCDDVYDSDDDDCGTEPLCILLEAGAEAMLAVYKGECGGAGLSGPFDVIRGGMGLLQIAGGHVDLGTVECVESGFGWDRLTEYSLLPNPSCMSDLALFYLAKNSTDPDYGSAATGERRDVSDPDPPCP